MHLDSLFHKNALQCPEIFILSEVSKNPQSFSCAALPSAQRHSWHTAVSAGTAGTDTDSAVCFVVPCSVVLCGAVSRCRHQCRCASAVQCSAAVPRPALECCGQSRVCPHRRKGGGGRRTAVRGGRPRLCPLGCVCGHDCTAGRHGGRRSKRTRTHSGHSCAAAQPSARTELLRTEGHGPRTGNRPSPRGSPADRRVRGGLLRTADRAQRRTAGGRDTDNMGPGGH